jgi:circadian clock protein KaiC
VFVTYGAARTSSGIEGLDRILNGGFPTGRSMLVEGAPGTGKTTLALQWLIAGAARGEKALFVSVAQSLPELELIAASHGMDLSGIEIHTPEVGATGREQIFSVESEEAELVELMEDVHTRLTTAGPDLFVFDSLLEVRLLAATATIYRRELLALRGRLRRVGATSLLIDHTEPANGERVAEGIVHGVIKLQAETPLIGATRRRLTVVKVRGAAFREGWHDYRINTGGIRVFPRVIPDTAQPAALEERLVPPHAPLARLLGGGLEFGTTLLVSGQSGTGKSTLSTLLARTAAARGVGAAMFLFEERPEVLRVRSAGVGLDPQPYETNGTLTISHFDPAEISPGEFSNAVLGAVDAGARLVVIDSLSGYFSALVEEAQAMTHMQALLQHLTRREVLTIVTVAQHGLLGEPATTRLDTSYLADTVILLRQYETDAEIRRSIAVLKKRHSEHERSIEELVIRGGAVEIRPLAEEAQGRAKSAPQFGGP